MGTFDTIVEAFDSSFLINSKEIFRNKVILTERLPEENWQNVELNDDIANIDELVDFMDENDKRKWHAKKVLAAFWAQPHLKPHLKGMNPLTFASAFIENFCSNSKRFNTDQYYEPDNDDLKLTHMYC